ncbi:hypothetical protein GCM10009867_23500 [Pedococcus aerophilus]|uniref:HNH nuclease domain-containing protein n=1 Tax=Pedococcus aerophilus TaxID=436356 RepID=A0ABN3UQF3_9MICO
MTSTPRVATLTANGFGRPVVTSASVARQVLAHAAVDRLWTLEDEDVAEALGVLGEVVAAARAQFVAVLAEAKERGLGTGQGWGQVDWVRAVAPSLTTRDVLDSEVVAQVLAATQAPTAPDLRLEAVVDAVSDASSPVPEVRAGALSVTKAAQLCRFHRGIRGLAEPGWLAQSTAGLLGGARGDRGWDEKTLATGLRRTADLARSEGSVERDAQVRREHRSLVKGPGPVGMWRYTLMLDEEGAAVVDAAVDALARPARDTGTGELDVRTPAARRADALLDLVVRAVGAPEGVPRQAKTSLVVTVPLEVLAQRCRGAGMTLQGQDLSVGVVRRLACDAQVVPVVLGTAGEVLDQGMARRLFDRAQIRHLWLRDGGCTFPGCSRPAAWSDAHHLVHWADGGPTDLGNAALLCRAHHTVVHTYRYAGKVRHEPGSKPWVEWDMTIGSYDQALHESRNREHDGAHDSTRSSRPEQRRSLPGSLPATG